MFTRFEISGNTEINSAEEPNCLYTFFIIFENNFQNLCSKDTGSKTVKCAFSLKHVNITTERNSISHAFRLRTCLV